MSIYKACDIRGKYPDEIDIHIAEKVGQALATITNGKPFIVGGDVRESTQPLKESLVSGLLSSGSDVFDIGTVPTPALYFARQHLGCECAVMVTASHNPPDHNGLKITLGPLPITETELLNIRQKVDEKDFTKASGKVSHVDILPDYKKYILDLAKVLDFPRKVKAVMDCGNGCTWLVADVLNDTGSIETHSIHCEPDGTFPNRSPNSADHSALGALSDAVKDTVSDIGFATDGDGDRITLCDENGVIFSSDTTISLIAKHVGLSAGDKVVCDIKCSKAVMDTVESLGATALKEKSGHTYIKTRMINEDAAIGGELSGHIFYRELLGGDDPVFTALVASSIVAKHGKLSALAASIPKYISTPDIRISTENAGEYIQKILASFSPEEVDTTDGVRVDMSEGWALARASVTEPAITLRFESTELEKLKSVAQRFLSNTPDFVDEVNQVINKNMGA